jgi:hypothetical protein
MIAFFALFVILLIALAFLTRVRDEAAVESFLNVGDIDPATLPNPQDILNGARNLLNKYDKPEVWAHIMNVKDKDPGELARMYLNIPN